jgi:cardiolipin synthase A/B
MTIKTNRPVAPLLAAALLGLGACGGPQAQGLVDERLEPVALADCRDCPDEAELARAGKTPEQQAFIKRVNALETALTGKPLSAGNRVELLRDGPVTHDAQLKAIAGARHHVHLITYILTDDTVGQDYLKALLDRRRAGVEVRLMFDSVGGRTVGEPFLDQLAKAGIEVRQFGPMDPTKSKGKDMTLTRRHHRKLLIVDGRVAFTGGVNISDEYRASSADTSKIAAAKAAGKLTGWRDTHVRIDGPGVAQFQQMFFESWALVGDPIKRADAYWPRLARKGDELVRGVNQQGNDIQHVALQQITGLTDSAKERASKHAIYGSYLAAIASARQRIWITQAYFIPNDEFMDALLAAAKRGVEIRMLVPGNSDIQMMVRASRFHYAPLLEAGGHIYEYEGPVLHAKTAVIDGVWATVGSSNLDFRSFIHNDEANAIILGHAFGEKMEAMFNEDLQRAKEITREQWARRSWSERFNQRMAVLFEYWI